MIFAYKFRIYPNPEQEQAFRRVFGCCRYVYNQLLAFSLAEREASGKLPPRFSLELRLASMYYGEETKWLQEVALPTLQASIWNLEKAFATHPRPRFKSRRRGHQSFRIQGSVRLGARSVFVPVAGEIDCRVSRPVRGKILNATVSLNPAGQYHIALCCLQPDPAFLPKTGRSVGLDMGLGHFAVTSDGAAFPNPRGYAKALPALARAQRRLSRKTKGSRRYAKARRRVARIHQRIANCRADMLHKLSIALVRGYDTICIEDLAPAQMMADHRFARSISDASWAEFRRQLTYKTKWYGKKLRVIDAHYPSSQICSACGTRWRKLKDLSVREWVCPICHTRHDRDRNAAANILKEGLKKHQGVPP